MAGNFTAVPVTNGQQSDASQLDAVLTDALVNAGDAAISTGSANAYLLALNTAIVAYSAAQVIKFVANFTNTGSATVNVNSIGAVTLKKLGTQNLVAGDIVTGQVVAAIYDGTYFQVISMVAEAKGDVGDGSDGAIVLDGSNTYSFLTKVSNTYTINNRDIQLTNVTINNGITLNTGFWRLFWNGVFTINVGGIVTLPGTNGGNAGNASNATGGSAGSAAAAQSGNSVPGTVISTAGATGASGVTYSNNVGGQVLTQGNTGNIVNGASVAKSIGSVGATGATGGYSGSSSSGGITQKAGGSGATGGTQTGTVYNSPHTEKGAYKLYDENGASYLAGSTPPGSGGSGAGGGTDYGVNNGAGYTIQSGGGGGSGGSGGSGGIIAMFGNILVNNGSIISQGGTGGTGGNGGTGGGNMVASGFACFGGGGGGGSGGTGGTGGVIINYYNFMSGSGTITVPGGAGGSGGSAGSNVHSAGITDGVAPNVGATGTTGATGVLILVQR